MRCFKILLLLGVALSGAAHAGGGSFAGGVFDGYMQAQENSRRNEEAAQRRQMHQIQIEQARSEQARQNQAREQQDMRIQIQESRQRMQDGRASTVVFTKGGTAITSGEVFSVVRDYCATETSGSQFDRSRTSYLCHCVAFKSASAVLPTRGSPPEFNEKVLRDAIDFAASECSSES